MPTAIVPPFDQPPPPERSGTDPSPIREVRAVPVGAGWRCFFCDEVFTTIGAARDHFGASPDSQPGCLVRVQYGDERGLQMKLREVEVERDEWTARALRAEDEAERLGGWPAEIERLFGEGRTTPHEAWLELDAARGAVLAAEAALRDLVGVVQKLLTFRPAIVNGGSPRGFRLTLDVLDEMMKRPEIGARLPPVSVAPCQKVEPDQQEMAHRDRDRGEGHDCRRP